MRGEYEPIGGEGQGAMPFAGENFEVRVRQIGGGVGSSLLPCACLAALGAI